MSQLDYYKPLCLSAQVNEGTELTEVVQPYTKNTCYDSIAKSLQGDKKQHQSAEKQSLQRGVVTNRDHYEVSEAVAIIASVMKEP